MTSRLRAGPWVILVGALFLLAALFVLANVGGLVSVAVGVFLAVGVCCFPVPRDDEDES